MEGGLYMDKYSVLSEKDLQKVKGGKSIFTIAGELVGTVLYYLCKGLGNVKG